MISVIFLFVISIIAIALYANNHTAVKPNKNMLLGVTLPYNSLRDNSVNSIVSEYKRMYTILILISIPLAVPILFVGSYPSISIIYLYSWIGALLYSNHKVYMKYTQKLLDLKRENNWFSGKKHIINVDTEVSRIKDKMPVSKLWFIPSFIVSIVPFAVVLLKKDEFGTVKLISSLLPIALVLLFVYLYKLTVSQKTTVYSEKTEINKACNFLHKRIWSICWVVVAFIESVAATILNHAVFSEKPDTLVPMLATTIPAAAILVCIIFTHKKIQDEQNRLLEADENPVYTDDDEYWQKGYYYNPNDCRTMVEKRIGYGYTINMATTKGKLLACGIVVTVAVLVLGLSLLFLKLDFSDFKLSVDGNKAVIDAAMYGYRFDIDKIEEVKKIDSIPGGRKTNGAETRKYSLGNYNLNGYGESKLYIYKDNPPYIMIKLKDIYLFINGKTQEQTEQYYEMLLKKMD